MLGARVPLGTRDASAPPGDVRVERHELRLVLAALARRARRMRLRRRLEDAPVVTFDVRPLPRIEGSHRVPPRPLQPRKFLLTHDERRRVRDNANEPRAGQAPNDLLPAADLSRGRKASHHGTRDPAVRVATTNRVDGLDHRVRELADVHHADVLHHV